MESEISMADLTLVAKLGENVLIFVRNEDLNENDPTALLYNTMFKSYHINQLNKMLALTAFEYVNQTDKILQDYFKNQIYRIISEDKLIESITQFNREILFGDNYFFNRYILKR